MEMQNRPLLLIDGVSMTVDLLMELGQGKYTVDLAPEAWERVAKARKMVDDILAGHKTVYGINTGFGNFADVKISDDKVEELQENLIRSHSAGMGDPLSPQQVRRLMALRINVLAKGHSGVSESTLKKYIECFNKDCLSYVPQQGTLGASGDLAPLAHLALGLLGEGQMWNPTTNSWDDAAKVLKDHDITPIKLKAKDGLSLINGTQMIVALGAEALHRAEVTIQTADIVCALSLEGLKGTATAFKPEIQLARPHPGQILSAQNVRQYLHSEKYPSEIAESHSNCGKVQDAYSLRCTPQVHGIVYDTVAFCKRILETEMNSATDNPMVFADKNEIISGGNFHGEYPAKVLDYLAIAIHEAANISERRTDRMMNPLTSGLPAFLVRAELGGLHSGFMIAHCTAAALVSENKTLAHPASVDSIPTSAGKEDHVSMGGWAARKCLKVVENVEKVIAIELMAACQAIDFLRPLKTTQPLEAVHSLVRSKVAHLEKDRVMSTDMAATHELVKTGQILAAVMPFMGQQN
jgi:histidine ammonia-lyase